MPLDIEKKYMNKDIIQSYILTTAKYDFSVYEKRILYRLVELIQAEFEKKKLNIKYTIEENLWGNKKFTMPIKHFLKSHDDKNYERIKKAFKDLEDKVFEYEDDEIWETIRIVYKPYINKRSESIIFEIAPKIYNALLDFSKEFRQYELEIAMSFKSIYSMRFYQLISNKKDPVSYSIDELKEMFKIQEKYNVISAFRRRIIEPSQNELNEKSPYTFTYKFIRTGRKVTHIKLYPIYQPEHGD